jgi:uncharacterized protein (DUF2062 family)
MPRRWFKQWSPDPASLRNHKGLGPLKRWLQDPNLWHLTRHSVSIAFLVGIFAALIPLPVQMLLAALGAIWLRGNVAVAVALTWATNPLTTPPLILAALHVGGWVLGQPAVPAGFELTWERVSDITLEEIERGYGTLLVGSIICGAVFGIIAMLAVKWFWRWHVVRRWRQRSVKRS